MALRDKLVERVQPHLEPGEQVQAVFLAQTGPSPWMSALSWLIVLFGAKYYIVAATDRAYVVLKAGAFVPSKPKGFDRRLDRRIRVGPLSGLWGKSTLLADKTYIHKRFHKDVDQADQWLDHMHQVAVEDAKPKAGWYDDPERPGRQRYFDGTQWTDSRT
jgi:hypothetical protein